MAKRIVRNRRKIMSSLYALELMLMGGIGAVLMFLWTFACVEGAYSNFGAGLPITGSSLVNFLIITGYELLFLFGVIVSLFTVALIKERVFRPFNRKVSRWLRRLSRVVC